MIVVVTGSEWHRRRGPHPRYTILHHQYLMYPIHIHELEWFVYNWMMSQEPHLKIWEMVGNSEIPKHSLKYGCCLFRHDYIPAQNILRWQSNTLARSKIQPGSLTIAPKKLSSPKKHGPNILFSGERDVKLRVSFMTRRFSHWFSQILLATP